MGVRVRVREGSKGLGYPRCNYKLLLEKDTIKDRDNCRDMDEVNVH